MKTNTTPAVVSNTATPATVVPGGFTLGLDLGDRRHHVCVLDAAGQILREGALTNTRPALTQLLADFPHATVALEAGTHSPWISRFLQERGATVLVANPRKLHAISRHERKCDRRDAQMLARLARGDLTRHGARVLEFTHPVGRVAELCRRPSAFWFWCVAPQRTRPMPPENVPPQSPRHTPFPQP